MFIRFDGGYRFDVYLHDYLVKKKMHKTAEIFKNESRLDVTDRVGNVLFRTGSYFMPLLFIF